MLIWNIRVCRTCSTMGQRISVVKQEIFELHCNSLRVQGCLTVHEKSMDNIDQSMSCNSKYSGALNLHH